MGCADPSKKKACEEKCTDTNKGYPEIIYYLFCKLYTHLIILKKACKNALFNRFLL